MVLNEMAFNAIKRPRLDEHTDAAWTASAPAAAAAAALMTAQGDDAGGANASPCSLVYILRPLLARGFLSTRDLFNVAFRTSKTMLTDAYGSTGTSSSSSAIIWKALCESHWGSDGAARRLASVNDIGRQQQWSARDCFRAHFGHPAQRPGAAWAQARPLRYRPSDYVLIVDVRALVSAQDGAPWAPRASRGLLFTQRFSGESIPEFFEFGKLEINLDAPVQVTVDQDEDEKRYMFPWEADVSLLLKPEKPTAPPEDQRCIQLLKGCQVVDWFSKDGDKEGAMIEKGGDADLFLSEHGYQGWLLKQLVGEEPEHPLWGVDDSPAETRVSLQYHSSSETPLQGSDEGERGKYYVMYVARS